jgi:hypothetical protein
MKNKLIYAEAVGVPLYYDVQLLQHLIEDRLEAK